jgi:hypothetical protein
MNILETIFGSTAKVKIIKLFLFNPEKTFDPNEVADRTKVSRASARKEIYNLEKIGFVRSKLVSKEFYRQKNREAVSFKKKVNGWTLDSKFPYIEELESFLTNVNPFRHKDIIDKISRTCKIQLLVVSGIFIKDPDSRVDLLVVGDNVKQGLLESVIRTIESEIGKEVRYAVFETREFTYRMSMFDRLIRDILDYPHEKIINKLNL